MSSLIAFVLAATPPAESWDLSYRVGYGLAMTTGVSSQRFGMGPSLAYLPWRHVRLEASALWSNGEEVRAGNETIVYRADYSSLRVTVGGAYEVGSGTFRARFGVRFGALYVDGYTRVGSAVARDHLVYGILGPSFALLVRRGRYEVGIDGEGLYLPRWVAAPIFTASGFVGIVF